MARIKFKWIVIVIDIIVIAVIVLLKIGVFSTKDNDEDVVQTNHTIVFKNFSYNVSDDITLTYEDDYVFTIENDNWIATIDIFKNNENGVFKYPELLQQQLTDFDETIQDYEYMSIDGDNYLVYRRNDNHSLLVYMEVEWPYAYEIDLFYYYEEDIVNDLKEIINIIKTASYDDSEEYNYVEAKYDESKEKS